MYSMVLLVAMTGAADNPACGFSYGGYYPCYGYGYGYCSYGYSSYGCSPCYSYPYSSYCYSGGSVSGGATPYSKPPAPPEEKGGGRKKVPPVDEGDGKKVNPGSANAAPAPRTQITVRLPADAKLFVDDLACPLTSATRTFETPPLEAGRAYTYTFKAEVTRNGKVLTTTQRLRFDAGKPLEVDLRNALGTVVVER
jgi:uncharacterized protein (TIGR03000 family)